MLGITAKILFIEMLILELIITLFTQHLLVSIYKKN